MKIFEELGEKISKAEISEMFRAVTNGDLNYVTSNELAKFLREQD